MTPAQGIHKLGFRRWYERELIEGHVYLITSLFSLIAVAACLEQIDWSGSATKLVFMLSAIIAGSMLGIGALRRYSFLMVRAECLGAQSNCTHCSAYGVLQVLAAGDGDAQSGELFGRPENPWIRVRCKKCGHEWRMDNA